MSAVPAYSYPQRQRQPLNEPRTRVRVVPGGGRRQKEQGVSPQILMLAKIGVVALVVVAAICCARVALSAATLSTSVQSQELSAQIETARESGTSLEVAQSTLSNPSNVRAAANELGMVTPTTTEFIDVGVDVVATDGDGNLSLTQSLERAGGLAE